jgi:hypothetical protein
MPNPTKLLMNGAQILIIMLYNHAENVPLQDNIPKEVTILIIFTPDELEKTQTFCVDSR